MLATETAPPPKPPRPTQQSQQAPELPQKEFQSRKASSLYFHQRASTGSSGSDGSEPAEQVIVDSCQSLQDCILLLMF